MAEYKLAEKSEDAGLIYAELLVERRGRDKMISDALFLLKPCDRETPCLDCIGEAVKLLEKVLSIDGWKK